MTGATCLEAMAVTIADAIVPHVLPFVQVRPCSPYAGPCPGPYADHWLGPYIGPI